MKKISFKIIITNRNLKFIR